MIAWAHLSGPIEIGMFALFFFYAISGYCMAAVRPKYSSPWRFLLSRVLRIYPLYWCAIAISAVLLLITGPSELHPDLILPHTASQWLENIFAVMTWQTSARLSPPAWALTVELALYVCAAAGWIKNKWTCAIGLTIGMLWMVSVNSWQARYYTGWGAFVPFFVGALVYHYELRIPKDKGASLLLGRISYPLFLLHWSIAIALLPGGSLSPALAFATIWLTSCLGLCLVLLVEVPIEKMRRKIKTPRRH